MSTPRDDYDLVHEVFDANAPPEVPIHTRIGFIRRMADGFIAGERERKESVLRDYAEVLKRIPGQFYQAVWNELVATWRPKFWPYPAHILETWDRVRPVEPLAEHPAMTKERARAQATLNAYGWLKSPMGQRALEYRVGLGVVRQMVDKGRLEWSEEELRALAMRRHAIRRETLDELQLERDPAAREMGRRTWEMLADGQDTAEEELARQYLKGYVPKGEGVRPAAEAAAATA